MKFTKKDYSLLTLLLKMEQPSLLATLKKYLTDVYQPQRVIANNRYVYGIGDIPVMLVAHLDTVHVLKPAQIYHDEKQGVIWSPQGLGADDRAGVYSIVKIINSGYRPHVLFTTDEEIGGVGARVAAHELEVDVNFIIELDRRGENDSVFYDCENELFEKYINKFGFKTNWGSFSDISVICPAWGIAGVNLSIGYDNEHTRGEMLNVVDMNNTIEKVGAILSQVDVEKDKFEYIAAAPFSSHNRYFDFDMYANNVKDPGEICYDCFNQVPKELVIKGPDDGTYCGDCYAKIFTTCNKCKMVFKDVTKTHILCPLCRKEATADDI